MTDIKRIIESLIRKSPASFISSIDAAGFPNIKALLPPRLVVGITTFYFTTGTASLHAGHFRENPKSSLYFCDQRHYVGVMLKGTMDVLDDSESKEMLWEDTDAIHYQGGASDPGYCVLKFTAIAGRLYHNFQSTDFAL